MANERAVVMIPIFMGYAIAAASIAIRSALGGPDARVVSPSFRPGLTETALSVLAENPAVE